MGMKNMSLLSGATLAATGGTALAFASNGITVSNGVQLVVPADTSYVTRRSITAKFRPPVVGRDGVLSRDKKDISLNKPLTLASGKVVNNVIRISREIHPELSAAEATELNKLAAQLLFDTDTDGFWATGSSD